jgi:hypothetical protein
MALRRFKGTFDTKVTIMKMSSQPNEPAKRPQASPERGAPPTYAAHAARKNVGVRVLLKPTAGEAEELREHGYGHGV